MRLNQARVVLVVSVLRAEAAAMQQERYPKRPGTRRLHVLCLQEVADALERGEGIFVGAETTGFLSHRGGDE